MRTGRPRTKPLQPCPICGNIPRRSQTKKPRCCKECFIKQGFHRGSGNPCWRGGRVFLKQNGYVLALATDHPFANPAGYVLEHRLVMEKHIGRLLKRTERVHHINGNRDDNRIENLHLCKDHAEHMRHHTFPSCKICGKKHLARGLCGKHYQQLMVGSMRNRFNEFPPVRHKTNIRSGSLPIGWRIRD